MGLLKLSSIALTETKLNIILVSCIRILLIRYEDFIIHYR
jgi:hypothetical protein